MTSPQRGRLEPQKILTEIEPMTGAIEAYKAFDQRQSGWIRVELGTSA
jgi:threonine dehydrogenase-like Zn-dependent dehydrogenase